MVTSNKLSDKKVVKMAEPNNSVVVPQRTLLGEVNEHITCPLCRGYYIDATTIVECLHSFCRSCIIKHLQVKSYCPVCEMMINSAKPNIKLDKALQDIVYKLVPGLFQKEMERRQQFYASRPGPAASATPEQRGEDTERIIFSPEDVISFSLEYADATDTDSISSKSSDSNEPQTGPQSTRRYLQCPAVVNISHLKKFLSMKFDIDSTQFAIDILYKRISLPDYYTLMDIAYIYNWKRNEPMRFFYQIIDYVAIRNRLFDINRKGSHFRDRKSSPAPTEETNASSPALNLTDLVSETSSGTDSPMPDDIITKNTSDSSKTIDKLVHQSKDKQEKANEKVPTSTLKKADEDVEKSQFLNSFELTAKSNCMPIKPTAGKSTVPEDKPSIESPTKKLTTPPKVEDKLLDTLKRKIQTPQTTPELKKLKVELEKSKISNYVNSSANVPAAPSNISSKVSESTIKTKENEGTPRSAQTLALANNSASSGSIKDVKPQPIGNTKQQVSDITAIKRTIITPQSNSSPKRKPLSDSVSSLSTPIMAQKTISPLKLQLPKVDTPMSSSKLSDVQKPPMKKIPDLKPSTPMSQTSQNKGPVVNKVRMDLLANNSDPTIDRSKILSQVKTSLSAQSPGSTSGDPLKSLFDSCKINIPSSLSITLTDQKLDPRSPDPGNTEAKKNIVNKNLTAASNVSTHKVPSPPVHNYIEILKLPDTDTKKQNKTEGNSNEKPIQNKTETNTTHTKPQNKSETSAKGPVPNLKPIADTKLGKQSGNFASPITFQQTFEQQLQSLQSDKKSKLPKNKMQVPKLVPATLKSLSAAGKPNNIINKPNPSNVSPSDNKTSAALDLSTPHIQSQLSSQQTYDKALETMQSIANLAKKQNLPSKGLPLSMTHSSVFPGIAGPLTTSTSQLRHISSNNVGQIKHDKGSPNGSQGNNSRLEPPSKTNQVKATNNAGPSISSPNYQIAHHTSPSTANPSPRSQTRSPSSSPKLVIAEEKQGNSSIAEHNANQSNQITSTQLINVMATKNDSSKASPGPSKPGLKPSKPSTSTKVTGIWQPLTSNMKTNPTMNAPTDYLSQQLARQLEVNAWMKAQRQFEFIKNMSNMAHQTQNDFNNKDKQ